MSPTRLASPPRIAEEFWRWERTSQLFAEDHESVSQQLLLSCRFYSTVARGYWLRDGSRSLFDFVYPIEERKWKVRWNSSSLFIYLFLTIEISIWNWHLLMYSYDLELIKNYYKFIKNFGNGSEEEISFTEWSFSSLERWNERERERERKFAFQFWLR